MSVTSYLWKLILRVVQELMTNFKSPLLLRSLWPPDGQVDPGHSLLVLLFLTRSRMHVSRPYRLKVTAILCPVSAGTIITCHCRDITDVAMVQRHTKGITGREVSTASRLISIAVVMMDKLSRVLATGVETHSSSCRTITMGKVMVRGHMTDGTGRGVIIPSRIIMHEVMDLSRMIDVPGKEIRTIRDSRIIIVVMFLDHRTGVTFLLRTTDVMHLFLVKDIMRLVRMIGVSWREMGISKHRRNIRVEITAVGDMNRTTAEVII